ncbi:MULTISPECIES: NfeD family protein [Burkholderia]|uniref:NfeD family protein n=1 Tax=Burkholderia gladioli TaxID=28095 RepID=A0A2A7S3D2_BURGA|nr:MULTISPECIES: NfeD family protein [Burkholderia]ATF83850.1 NfeD family protein [Burkholderia gladioli pv. gladioli]MBJ9662181.1 NfeD family protein [Burkholderia gladioli]MBJ9709746.1 NfeD family protein [Burkholderia gladioli]MBU9153742.1 NfeD family protein [Burkholderia gladioli]MBU9166535.1 NfeD family protein [Burkholderia gladioli]
MLSGQLIWWIGVGVLVVAELMTGTFYLLMVAIGFVAGGLVHLAGGAPHAQLAAAAVVAVALLVVLRRSRLGSRQKRDASANPDINLDIGATLTVEHWQDGRARVSYRGADWDVELAAGERDDAQLYEVRALRGNCLVVVAKSRG